MNCAKSHRTCQGPVSKAGDLPNLNNAGPAVLSLLDLPGDLVLTHRFRDMAGFGGLSCAGRIDICHHWTFRMRA